MEFQEEDNSHRSATSNELEDYLNRRERGQQCTVQIGEEVFYVVSHWGHLAPQDFTRPVIKLEEIERMYQPIEGRLQFLLDPSTNQVMDSQAVYLYNHLDHYIAVQIPDLKGLDPYGFARRHNLPFSIMRIRTRRRCSMLPAW